MLDKEIYTREEVEDIIHRVKCDVLLEETVRLDKTLKYQKAYDDMLLLGSRLSGNVLLNLGK